MVRLDIIRQLKGERSHAQSHEGYAKRDTPTEEKDMNLPLDPQKKKHNKKYKILVIMHPPNKIKGILALFLKKEKKRKKRYYASTIREFI